MKENFDYDIVDHLESINHYGFYDPDKNIWQTDMKKKICENLLYLALFFSIMNIDLPQKTVIAAMIIMSIICAIPSFYVFAGRMGCDFPAYVSQAS